VGRIEDTLRGIAAEHDGYFTSSEAEEAGIKRAIVVQLKHRGRLERIDRGLYRLANWPQNDRQDYHRALLWPTAHRNLAYALISHDSALELYGLSDLNPDSVHVTVPAAFRARRAIPHGCESIPRTFQTVIVRASAGTDHLDRACYRADRPDSRPGNRPSSDIAGPHPKSTPRRRAAAARRPVRHGNARDVLDVLLLTRRLAPSMDELRTACARIFSERRTHAGPVERFTFPAHWSTVIRELAHDIGYETTDTDVIQQEFNHLLARVNGCSPMIATRSWTDRAGLGSRRRVLSSAKRRQRRERSAHDLC
jgi:hypothetical protein